MANFIPPKHLSLIDPPLSAKMQFDAGQFVIYLTAFGLGIIGPALPSLADQTGSTLGAIDSIFLVGASGGLLGTVLAGPYIKR